MADVPKYTTVARPRDYWMSPKALSITRNALEEANRIAASVTGGSQFFCHFEDIGDQQAEALFGYDVAHNFRSWPLNISQTFFNTNDAILPHIAIPRRDKSDAKAMVVFPTERLDLWGYATEAVPMQDDEGNYINDKGDIVDRPEDAATAYVRKKKTDGSEQDADPIGSEDYYYIYLHGKLTSSGSLGNIFRVWDPEIDWGRLNTDETWGEVITIEQLAKEMKKKVDVEWFQRVFTIHGTGRKRKILDYDEDGEPIYDTDPETGEPIWEGSTERRDINPNDMDHEITDTESMYGTWTEQFLSALGIGSGGGGGGQGGDGLEDPLLSINNAGLGQPPTLGTGKIGIVYNYATGQWEWGKTGGGLSGLTLKDGNDVITPTGTDDNKTYNLGAEFLSLTYGGTVLGNVEISGATLTITSRPQGFTAGDNDVLTRKETEDYFDDKYVTVSFFESLFKVYNGSNLIETNGTIPNPSTNVNIKAMFGFWTEQYLSALGKGSGGSGGGASYLSMLEDVTISNPSNGDALVYHNGEWVNGSSGIDATELNNVLYTKKLRIKDGNTQLGNEWNAKDGGDIDISGIFTGKKWWNATMSNGEVKGDIQLTGNITPENNATTSTGSTIGSNNLRYKAIYVNEIHIGSAVISWNTTHSGLEVTEGMFSDKWLSALGAGSQGGGISLNDLLMSLNSATIVPTGQTNKVLVNNNGTWSWQEYGGGTPVLRTLTISDGTTSAVAYNPSSDTQAKTLTVNGEKVSSTALVTVTANSTAASLTVGLATAYGDTKNPYAAKSAHYVLAGPASGTDLPAFRQLTPSDISNLSLDAQTGVITIGENNTITPLTDAIIKNDYEWWGAKLNATSKKREGDMTNVGSITVTTADYGTKSITGHHALVMYSGKSGTINGGHIDFYFYNSTSGKYPNSYTSRIIEGASGRLDLNNTVFANLSGNVGIGNSSPSVKLDVDGDVRVTQRIYFHKDASNSDNDIYLEYVSGQGGVHLHGAGFYADQYVSSLGLGSNGTPAGFDEAQMWDALGVNSGTYQNRQIDIGHLTTALSGYVKGVKYNNGSAISPDANGIVDLGTISGVGDYLPLTGGTLTGDLNEKVNAVDMTLGNNNISSTQWKGFRVLDANGRRMAQFIDGAYASGSNGFWISACNYKVEGSNVTQYDKGFGLFIDKDGKGIWTVHEPESFREAIGINLDSYLPLTAGSGKKLTGSLYLNARGMGVFMPYSVDGNTVNIPLIYDNGANLWIGATETGGTHHVGSTYISAGSGDAYVSRLIDGVRTNKKILDAGNTYVSGGVGYINGTQITALYDTITRKFWNQTYWQNGKPVSSDVTGALKGTGSITIENTGTTASLFIAKNGTGEVRFAAYETNRGVYDGSGSAWIIGTGPAATNPNTFLMRGNVGIGTSGPNYKLDVSGTGHFTGDVTLDNNLNMLSGKYVKFKIDGDYTSALGVWGGDYKLLQLGYNTAHEKSYATNIYGNVLRLYGSSTTLGMLINNSGDVGVGTTSPGAKLDVNGQFKAQTYLTSWNATGSNGTEGCVKVAEITIKGTYPNQPLKFRVTQRGRMGGEITIRFTNAATAAGAGVSEIFYTGDLAGASIVQSGTVYSLYVKKAEGYDLIGISLVDFSSYANGRYTVAWANDHWSYPIVDGQPDRTAYPSGSAIATCRYYFASNVYMEYDATNKGVHVVNAGLYANTYVSSLGAGSTGQGGSANLMYPLSAINDANLSTSPLPNSVIMYKNGRWQYEQVTGSGTVTSVNLAMPTGFTVSGGPVTTNGTLTVSFGGSLTANKVLASPNGAAGAPSWRSLVAADITSGQFDTARIPDLSSTYATASRATTLEGYFTNGVANSALKLSDSKKLWGNDFDGTQDIGKDANNTAPLSYVSNINSLLYLGNSRLGVGTAANLAANSPYKFYVNGVSGFSNGAMFRKICIECGNNGADDGSKSSEINNFSNALYLQTSATGDVYLCNSSGNGKVGIKNTDPQYALDVTGSIRSTANSYFTALELSGNNGGYPYIDFHHGGSATDFTSRLKSGSETVTVNGQSVNRYYLTVVSKDDNEVDTYAGLKVGEGSNGDYIKIGGAKIIWDNANQALHIDKGVYSDSFVSSLGMGSGGSSGGGIDMDTVWSYLNNNASGHSIGKSNDYLTSLYATNIYAGGKQVLTSANGVTLTSEQTISGNKKFSGFVGVGIDTQAAPWQFAATYAYVHNYLSIGAKSTTYNLNVNGTSYFSNVARFNSNVLVNGMLTVGGVDTSSTDNNGKITLDANENLSITTGNNIQMKKDTYFSGKLIVGSPTKKPNELVRIGGSLSCDGSIYTYGTEVDYSDIRLKDVISQVEDLSVEKIARAPIFRFMWKDRHDTEVHVGTSAQYWQSVLPEPVSVDEDGYLGLSYSQTALAAAVMTARKVLTHEEEIDDLKRRLSSVELENRQLRQEIELLKAA